MPNSLRSALQANINRRIVGKSLQIDLLLTALLCGGHVLIEDVPGTGKTTLLKTFAQSIDGSFKRIQFTPDLLPADITGINFFDMKSSEFRFMAGPIFANAVLADEINRATPKTQSGLLECMEERQITIDGVTYPMLSPFIVIATQNPIESRGVFPLPEAQLDRFFMKIPMGENSIEEDMAILKMHHTKSNEADISAVITSDEIAGAQRSVEAVSVHDDIFSYILAISAATKSHDDILLGISPRGAIALLKAAKCNAALADRRFVIPDDVKSMARYILPHRIVLRNDYDVGENIARRLIADIIEKCPAPTENFARYSR